MASRGLGAWPGERNVALLGASTLKGKEIKAVFEERGLPLRRLLLVDTEEAQGQLTEFDGEPAIVQPVNAETFEGMDLAIFASATSFTQEHWRQAQQSGCRIIDVSYFLESESQARLRAPLLALIQASCHEDDALNGRPGEIAVSAHPMSIALSGVLTLLARQSPVVRAVATLFEPASEHGQAGVEELHRQTVSLLSFQELPTRVFDAQIAFNLLNRNGEHSRPTLHEEQLRIGSHFRGLVAGRTVAPALHLLQAPVFHGYSFCCWVQLTDSVEPEKLEAALDQKPFAVFRQELGQPNVVSVAGSDDIALGSVEPDPSQGAAYWVWGAFDNLRIAAMNATRIAEQMLGIACGTVPAESSHPSFPL